MRHTTVGNFNIEYPEFLVYLYDNNVISIANGVGNVGVHISVNSPTGEQKQLEYYSSNHILLITLSDIMVSMHNGNISTYSVVMELYENDVLTEHFTFTFKIIEGKSFTNRSHFEQSTMYIYNPDELAKVFIFSPENATATVNGYNYQVNEGINALNLTGVITTPGEYTICLTSTASQPMVVISNVTDSINEPVVQLQYNSGAAPYSTILPICHTLVFEEACPDFNVFEIRYVNNEGCIRHLAGRLMEESNRSDDINYNTLTTQIYHTLPLQYISENERTVKVAYEEIAYNAFISDIMTSQSVQYRSYNGEWYDCSIMTDKIVTEPKEDFCDFTLEFIISKY